MFLFILLSFAMHRNTYKTISTQISKATNITYNTILKHIIIIIIIIVIIIIIIIIYNTYNIFLLTMLR